MSEPDPRFEAAAEAVVFAHESNDAMPFGAAALERAAALAAAAFAGSAVPPRRLQDRLMAAGLAFCAEVAAARVERGAAARPRSAWVPAFLLGIAAGVALWFALQGTPPDAGAEVRRTRLLANDPACLTIPWQAGPSPLRGSVQGDVVWSERRQEGYLTLRGLPPQDGDHCFQLWIVDGKREGAPVDGGVFDVADARTATTVPVRPALPIGAARTFVVTVEPRGGVVVSKQEHVVAIASR